MKTLYLDGIAQGANSAVCVALHQLGRTMQNWIGRSSYAVDPYFPGCVQDLRIDGRGFSAQEVAALAGG